MARKYKATIDTPHGPRTCFAGQRRTQRQETTGRTVRWHSARRQKNAVLTDRHPAPVTYPPQGADHTAPERDGARCASNGRGASPPRPQARRPRQPGQTTARVGTDSWRNGDARPSWSAQPATTPSTPATNRDTHGVVTGEPDAVKARTSGVRREALRCIPDAVGRNLEEVFLGRLAYLDAKARGDKSMPGKRWPSGGVQGGVPQDPRDMAKAGLLEAQSPAVKVRTHRNDA